MMYQERLKDLLIKGVIGFVIGLFFYMVVMGHGMSSATLLFGLLYTGLPYGWMLMGRVIDFAVIGSLPVMAIAAILRFAVSLMVGMFAYPVVLIYTIVKAVQEKKA